MTALTTSWLAARRGIDPTRIERLRRAGELYAVRSNGAWTYPAWQFDDVGDVKPAVRRLLALASEHGLNADAIEALLERRVGLVGGSTVRELLLNGGEEHALAEARRAASARMTSD